MGKMNGLLLLLTINKLHLFVCVIISETSGHWLVPTEILTYFLSQCHIQKGFLLQSFWIGDASCNKIFQN